MSLLDFLKASTGVNWEVKHVGIFEYCSWTQSDNLSQIIIGWNGGFLISWYGVNKDKVSEKLKCSVYFGHEI